ncbi:hypothetical protein FQR65_LT17776 [Abscondita terminalis]|nr:hypothetical protein FQR65_LT17776 [Abscondita terminalis]
MSGDIGVERVFPINMPAASKNLKITEKITLPDGSIKEFEASVTPLQVAHHYEGLARNTISALVNGTQTEVTTLITEDATVQLFTWNDDMDLCRGGHIPATGIVKAVKILNVSGAYWRGDEKNKQLTRVYGITFPKQKDLTEYLERLEEAKRRDHRKLGFADFTAQVSLRDKENREKYIGSEENWEKAEHAIINAANKKGLKTVIEYGEAAFYGPKLDFMVKDALDRSWQLGTIQAGLDLVAISDKAEPYICRILDYKKFLYEQKKKQKELKAKQVKVVVKEIRFGPQTDDHDYEFKKKHAEKFLEEGAKLKTYVFFKGRSIIFKDQGEILLLKLAQELEHVGKVDQLPKLEGKRMIMMMSPKKPGLNK